jgi:transposase
MLSMDRFAEIRRARRDGLTIRAIADQFGHSTKTVYKALAEPEPQPYTLAQPRPAPVFGPFQGIVDAIVEADQTAPRKQRHTAAQIFRRLCAEYGYAGGYDQVRRYLQSRRLNRRETFIPLEHLPGHRAEADFGHIAVDFPDGRRQVPVLVVTWSYSNAPFAIALPNERTEAILHGLVQAFHFFQAVPKELWWDNPKTVAIHLFRGRQRTLHPRYAALASHYTFTPKFCLPAKATEKPHVEHRVYDLERRWATPVPRVLNHDELNAHLRRCCVEELNRISGDHPDPVGKRFERDRAAALPPPNRSFDACVPHPGQVDKYQTVRFDHNTYSVPRRFAFRPVTVKGYIDRVEIVADGQVVARHARCYERGKRLLDPLHYLVVLEQKPAALDHAPVYRDWQLPPAFGELRRFLEQRHGHAAGARQFIVVLQLLAQHPVSRVEQAILDCRARGQASAATISAEAERLAHIALLPAPPKLASSLLLMEVPAPDLGRFNCLLSSSSKGVFVHGSPQHLAAQGELEAVETADDLGRI